MKSDAKYAKKIYISKSQAANSPLDCQSENMQKFATKVCKNKNKKCTKLCKIGRFRNQYQGFMMKTYKHALSNKKMLDKENYSF